jgi:hypothetical protein
MRKSAGNVKNVAALCAFTGVVLIAGNNYIIGTANSLSMAYFKVTAQQHYKLAVVAVEAYSWRF